MPICIIVEAEIKDDRMEEFVDMIEKNAIGSRAEPGCIRFGAYRHDLGIFLSPPWYFRFFRAVVNFFLDLTRYCILPRSNSTIRRPLTVAIDVLQAEDAPNKFFFYEIYRNSDDISHHKEQPHYLAWVAFKESGGTISSVSKKASGKFLT